jgi:hypothetical protein
MFGPLRIIPGISLGSALMETGSAARSGGSVYTNTHSATVDGVNQSIGGIAANSLLTRALATTTDEATIAFSVYTTYVNPFTVGQWHHVALVFSVGGDTYWDVDLYVDGVMPSINFLFSASNTSVDPGGKFNFAKNALSSTFSRLEFDEIACWDNALLPEEIQELAGSAGDPHGNLD